MAARPFDSGQICEDREHPGFVPECPWGMFSPPPIIFTVLLAVTIWLSHLDWKPLQGRAKKPEIL